MAILPPTIFASIVSSSKDELSRVSKIIRNDCNGDAETFQKACDALDYKVANEILDKTFKLLTGHEHVSMGLLYFASGLAHHLPNIENEVANAFSDVDKIKALAKHYSEIMKGLNSEFKESDDRALDADNKYRANLIDNAKRGRIIHCIPKLVQKHCISKLVQKLDEGDNGRNFLDTIEGIDKIGSYVKRVRSSSSDSENINHSMSIDNKRILMELIHALSAVYAKTNRFLNSGR